MKKNVDLKKSGVMELGKEELKEIEGGVGWIIGVAIGLTIKLVETKAGTVGDRAITDEQYAECFEGCTGVEYDSSW